MSVIQRYLTATTAAVLLGCASIAPVQSSDGDGRLSDALEQALPTVVSSGDYWSASKLYFQLASARGRMNQTSAACAALSQSLAYYRKALAKETDTPISELTSSAAGDDDGMQDVRARFGCTKAQFS